MQFIVSLALFAAAAVAQTGTVGGARNVTTVTQIVDEIVTYCPEPTVIVINDECYTVTEPTTLTITNCPCTITTTVPAGPTYPVVRVPDATGGYVHPPTPEYTHTAAAGPSADPSRSIFGLAVAAVGLGVLAL
ncbi:hypothetical protein PpBr36_01014 [Pyricularia pennisetigena]|uniref:hypothetical protein n=1 Tax=Pyricularia pennisetigena TaxID=1578925 RepID=UPI00115116A5|nr:hypothetical protein PpBr36_01014 [Pyricularia pennisetigena]TLS27772.1 hypothetical protein PpBr36_01014 [Pyricularia pennisetigena]